MTERCLDLVRAKLYPLREAIVRQENSKLPRKYITLLKLNRYEILESYLLNRMYRTPRKYTTV